MRTRNEVEADIAAAKEELQNVHGAATEVYARIVGYYRSVRNWNKGKREEFTERKMFTGENSKTQHYADKDYASNQDAQTMQEPVCLEVYTRRTCPNCPPVKAYCEQLGLPAVYIDTDTQDGIQTAAKHNVRACPTVIIYGEDKQELSRAYSVADLKACFTPYTAEAVTA